jgi:inorganic phosphate transporter, PiT family
MLIILLTLAAMLVAYANGANDNFKGVASLFGSQTCGYRTAIVWATVTTFAGSIVSIFLAQTLLKKFSGAGIVPDHFAGSQYFLLAVAAGAGVTVMIATLTGFPISTTHALTGAIIGSGLVAVGSQVNIAALGKGFVLPLLLSPILAIAIAGILYIPLHALRVATGLSKEWCICVGSEERIIAVSQPSSVFALRGSTSIITLSVDEQENCRERYVGSFLGIGSQHIMDAAHFLSAGTVSFARGLNDTPKIVALLLLWKALDIRLGFVAVATAVAIGGLLNARRVAETMSRKITTMNHGQGLTANLTTAILVVSASLFGLPVSTTHVSVGSLFGIGLTTGKANWRMASAIVSSWLITLPCAAIFAGVIYQAANSTYS